MKQSKRERQAIAAGFSAFKENRLDAARRYLAGADHYKALHLSGLIEKKAGNFAAAANLLVRAADLAPNDHDIACDQGRNARQRGMLADAEAGFKRALQLKPGHRPASLGLGRVFIDTERWQEAKSLYACLLQSTPESVPVRYAYATVLLAEGGATDAQRIFTALIEAGEDSPEVRFMRARARLELCQTEQAITDLQVSFKADATPLTLKTLAGALWMQGDERAFKCLLDAAASRVELLTTVAELFRQSGSPTRALHCLESAWIGGQSPADAHAIAALAYIDSGRAAPAEKAALKCLAMEPGHRPALGSLISALLMRGRAQESMQYIQRMRIAEPQRQHWIAYEACALRLLASPRHDELVNMQRFVHTYALPIPSGFASLVTFNEAFIRALDRWQPYQARPLDQSLRGGSQTSRDLTAIADPTIQAFIAALDEPIRHYMQAVGSGDDHPLTRRNTGNYRIAGCWSVRLGGGGSHVNHVHPDGWISSAYYAAVPEETRAGHDKAGWIKFGEPPFETMPRSPPLKWIRPQPGMLVLFPSYLWHGTAPIYDNSVRVTAPFDAVPA